MPLYGLPVNLPNDLDGVGLGGDKVKLEGGLLRGRIHIDASLVLWLETDQWGDFLVNLFDKSLKTHIAIALAQITHLAILMRTIPTRTLFVRINTYTVQIEPETFVSGSNTFMRFL